MANPFDVGGGGGRAPSDVENENHALAQPYEIVGEWGPETARAINEMFDLLFRSCTKNANAIDNITPGGSGDVVGPSLATSDNLAKFDGGTGKLIADSGVAAASVVTGPNGATDGQVAAFDGTTGHKIKALGFSISADSVFEIATATLTDAEFRGLNGTPKVLAAVAGSDPAGTILVPALIVVTANLATSFSATPTLSVRWVGGVNNLATIPSMAWSGAAGQRIGFAVPASNGLVFDASGVSLQLISSANVTGGSTSGGIGVTLFYKKVQQ